MRGTLHACETAENIKFNWETEPSYFAGLNDITK